MIAEVVGAVQIPMPVARISVGQVKSEYVECRSKLHTQPKPTAISSVPMNSTSRRPSFGTYQNDSAEKMPSGTMNGAKAIAVCQRRVAHDLLDVLHADIEEPERRAEQNDDRRHPGSETGVAEQPYVEKRISSSQFDNNEGRRDHHARDDPAPDQWVDSSPDWVLPESRPPRSATAAPISTAPSASSRGAVSSREDATVHARTKITEPRDAQ